MPKGKPYTPPPDKTENPVQTPAERHLKNQRVVKLGDAIAIVVRGNEILSENLLNTVIEQINDNLGLNPEGITKFLIAAMGGLKIPGKGTLNKALINQVVELLFSLQSQEALRQNLNTLANTQVEQLEARKLRQGNR